MRGQRWLRILAGVLTVVVGLSLFAGCSFYKVKEDGEALTYDICDDTMLPEELLSVRVQVSGVFAMRVMPETAMPRSSYCFSAR